MLAILMIIGGVFLRLIPHIPNVAPITAMALFGGVYLNKKYALLIPLLIMFISDFFLGFHNLMFFVYGSFLLTGIIGLQLKKHKSYKFIFISSLVSSTLFFIITNFGVWLVSGMYAKTIAGLVNCYLMAIPFFRNTVFGDLFYTGAFFGGYELVLNLKFVRRLSKGPVRS